VAEGGVVERDASGDVWVLLEQATEPLSTAQVVEALRHAHDEEAVVQALEHWRVQGVVAQDVDGRWSWVAPR